MTNEQEKILRAAKYRFNERPMRNKLFAIGPVYVEINGKELCHLVDTFYHEDVPGSRDAAIERSKEAALKFLERTDFSYDSHEYHNFYEVGADA